MGLLGFENYFDGRTPQEREDDEKLYASGETSTNREEYCIALNKETIKRFAAYLRSELLGEEMFSGAVRDKIDDFITIALAKYLKNQ